MQMGRFPKPCKKGKEMYSLSIHVSLLSLFNLTPYNPPQLRFRYTVGACHHLFAKQEDGTETPCDQPLAGYGCLLFILENSLYGKAALCMCQGESVAIFRQSSSSSSSSCRNHFANTLISGPQKGNLVKGFVMRLSVTLFTRSWRLSGSKEPLCVGL